MNHPNIAVIVPTLNEAEALERTLPAIPASAAEVIVSDGGSTDRTMAVAGKLGARTVVGPPGRGPQLNRGALASQAEALLFLHADTVLPEGALEAVGRALAAGATAGGFSVRFGSRRPIYRLGSAIVNLRTRLTRSPLGDQGQFATRAAFDAVGGFPEWPILEDLEFIRRAKRNGRIAILDRPATTSTRRFDERGIARTIARNWMIFSLYYLGVRPERLARLYSDVR